MLGEQPASNKQEGKQEFDQKGKPCDKPCDLKDKKPVVAVGVVVDPTQEHFADKPIGEAEHEVKQPDVHDHGEKHGEKYGEKQKQG